MAVANLFQCDVEIDSTLIAFHSAIILRRPVAHAALPPQGIADIDGYSLAAILLDFVCIDAASVWIRAPFDTLCLNSMLRILS